MERNNLYGISNVESMEARRFIVRCEAKSKFKENEKKEFNDLHKNGEWESKDAKSGILEKETAIESELPQLAANVNVDSLSQQDYEACLNAMYGSSAYPNGGFDEMLETNIKLKLAFESMSKEQIVNFCMSADDKIKTLQLKQLTNSPEFAQHIPNEKVIATYTTELKKAFLEKDPRIQLSPDGKEASSAIINMADKIHARFADADAKRLSRFDKLVYDGEDPGKKKPMDFMF